MQQHPIPQNVTAYEFHLIGNMTVKQFLELGGGVGVGVLFYSTNLPAPIKFFLVLMMVGVGAALAFLPFDGRPLDKMILVFLKAVYAPTQFIWQKQPHIPAFFQFTSKKFSKNTETATQRVRKNLKEYLSTLPETNNPDALNDYETKFISNVTSLFQSMPVTVSIEPTELIDTKGTPRIRVRKMKPASEVTSLTPELLKTVQAITMVDVPVAPAVKVTDFYPDAGTAPTNSEEVAPTPVENTTTLPTPDTISSTNPFAPASLTAAINPNLPFPSLPPTPNTLVGMVTDPYGRIVENAIVEVRDNTNIPVRALKTNKLGQFISATPLANGSFQIEVEKEGFKFDIVNITLIGDRVSPIEIRAKLSN
jgi:hypothetical protein